MVVVVGGVVCVCVCVGRWGVEGASAQVRTVPFGRGCGTFTQNLQAKEPSRTFTQKSLHEPSRKRAFTQKSLHANLHAKEPSRKRAFTQKSLHEPSRKRAFTNLHEPSRKRAPTSGEKLTRLSPSLFTFPSVTPSSLSFSPALFRTVSLSHSIPRCTEGVGSGAAHERAIG